MGAVMGTEVRELMFGGGEDHMYQDKNNMAKEEIGLKLIQIMSHDGVSFLRTSRKITTKN